MDNGTYTRNRIRISEKIDEKLILSMNKICAELGIHKSHIVEYGIRYILKKKVLPKSESLSRKSINLTIDPEVWKSLKEYSETNNIKLVTLLEAGLKYSIRRFKKLSLEKI